MKRHPSSVARISVRISVISGALIASFSSPAVFATETPTVVISATRFADSLLGKPLSISVISAEDIARSAVRTLPELLAQQAGISITDFNGNNGASATIDIRGFGVTGGQNTLVLLNGRRVSDMDFANVNWAAIPLDTIARVEVLRGSGSVQFGDNAAGGVINIITYQPTSKPQAQVSARFGSYATREVSASAGAALGGLDLNASASHYQSDGYRANNQSRQTNASLSLMKNYGAGSLQASLDSNWLTMRLPGPRRVVLGTATDELRSNRRGTSRPNDDSAREGAQLALDWRHRFDNFEVALDITRRTRDQWIYSANDDQARGSDMALDSISPRLRMPHTLLGGKASLSVGLDWQQWNYVANSALNVANIGRPFSTTRADQSNLGLYAQESVDLSDRLSALAGIRRERQKLSASNTIDPTAACPFGFCPFSAAAPGSRSFSENAWEFGLRYRLSDAWAGFAKTARGFRFANIDEIGNELDAFFSPEIQFLRPQTNRLVEGGVQWSGGNTFAKATVFQNDVRDEIHLDAFTAGIGNTNLSPTRRRGIELEGDWRVTETLRLNAAYTNTRATFRSGSFAGGPFVNGGIPVLLAGKTVPLVPRQKLNLGGSWEFLPGTRLNTSVARVGEQFMDNDEGNTLGATIPAYTVVDLKLEQRTGPWVLALAINNVLNEKYFTYGVKSQFTSGAYNAYPMPERNAAITAEYRFR